MSHSPIHWLGGDILVEDRRFCHGDNGVQEFYETIIAAKGVLLGLLRNHGEDIWVAYMAQGKAIRTLTGCMGRTDGKIDAEPLYDTPNDPQSLTEGLVQLWREHGERILTLPCRITDEEE